MNPPLSFAFVSALLSCIANADHSDVECFTKMVQHVTQCAVEGLLNTDCGMRSHSVEFAPKLTVKKTTVYSTRKQLDDFTLDITPTELPKILLLLSKISPTLTKNRTPMSETKRKTPDWAFPIFLRVELLTRLLKPLRQPMPAFALLGAHQAQSPSFRQPHVLLEAKLDRFRQIHSFAYQLVFHGDLSEALVYDVLQLNIRLTKARGLSLPDEPQEGRNRSWAVEEFSVTL
ncbi:LOW QUALITY PROTEIN: hypothetical protein T265_13294 [Opisthorchis viverrini]|uniref:Uncharacterized protein n=1 Tax=Opisthorchis viverrini TaxID=6198 RepID=A0A075A2N3_OPIVI|nr:LOW QUALITY PROTEIN: hypothetical protein T265_13294 [Opisthorchis viverrini]KER29815.1 LOW QUALITY PROTEIN: hypothetical protein T265_13294 [Opisthorchis viverrini]